MCRPFCRKRAGSPGRLLNLKTVPPMPRTGQNQLKHYVASLLFFNFNCATMDKIVSSGFWDYDA